MIVSRCGLLCGSLGCNEKYNCNCAGCLNADQPFHGRCPVKDCCEARGHSHCGECDMIPCDKLFAYSYLDPEHGDHPQGARIDVCRKWAAEGGRTWSNVLLTSAGWEDEQGNVKQNIRNRFLAMLGKPPEEARVLFVTAAAVSDEHRYYAGLCRRQLINAGIRDIHIEPCDLEHPLSAGDAMPYDVVYLTGGDTVRLLRRIRETGFDAVIKKMVYADKVYVGVSAGSLVAAPSIGGPYDKESAGLALVNAYLSVHCPAEARPRTDLPLPHLALTDSRALAVSCTGYELVSD